MDPAAGAFQCSSKRLPKAVPVHEPASQAAVAFPVSCNAEAQTRMNRAVAMLHSYWFPTARETFESVVQADAGCGIAYWGVAMTHFGNPMASGSTADGQAAGWQAAQTAARIGGRTRRTLATRAAQLPRDERACRDIVLDQLSEVMAGFLGRIAAPLQV